MRKFTTLLLATLGTILPSAASDSSLGPLPEWTMDDFTAVQSNDPAGPILGGLLWPRGPEGGLNVDANGLSPALEIRRPGVPYARIADSPDQAQPPTDVGNFLPPIQHTVADTRNLDEPVSNLIKPTPLSALKEVDSTFITSCYEAAADTYIIDPAYHLSELEREDMERFLSYHARDAKIRAYALVIGKDEKITSDLDLAKVAGGSLLKDNTCLLVLPFGEPWRARLFFTSNIHQSASATALNELMAECIRDGQTQSQPSEQAHRMLVRLSIRLFWLQNQLAPATPATAVALKQQPAKPPIPLMKAPVAMSEVMAEPPPSLIQKWYAVTGVDLRTAVGLIAGLAILLLTMIRWHRYKLRHYEWILPEPVNITQRLGGLHSGGGGAWLAYR